MNCLPRGGVGARDQQRMPPSGNRRSNFSDLARGLAQAQDDFGKALAGGTVMVHPGEAQVGQRLGPESGQKGAVRVAGGRSAVGHRVEESAQLVGAHGHVSCLFC